MMDKHMLRSIMFASGPGAATAWPCWILLPSKFPIWYTNPLFWWAVISTCVFVVSFVCWWRKG